MNVPHPDLRPRPARPRPARRLLIHAFVFVHLAAVILFSFTDPNSPTEAVQKVRAQIGKYFYPTGLWQRWDMFAPDPPDYNGYVEAEVTLRDGTHVNWPFPRMRRLGLTQRYLKERYRKWGQERVWREGHPDPLIATAAARYIARQVERPDNPARTVELVGYRTPIPRPSPEALARPWPAEPTGWTRQPFFTCDFDDAGKATARPQTQPSSQPSAQPSAQPTTGPTSQPAARTPRPDDATGGTKP